MDRAGSTSQRWADAMIACALALAACALYVPTLSHGVIDFDDPTYTTHPMVAAGISGESVRWAFTTTTDCTWFPLTWLSHMLDVQLFGPNYTGHHATSILLHAVNMALVFLVLRMITGSRWRSAVVAALLAAHPLCVETVAWIAERKGVLSSTFLLAMLLAYALHARRPSLWRFAIVVVAFAAAVMTKPAAVTAPALLLLLDYWPLRRRGWIVLIEKIPLLIIAGAISVATIVAHEHCGAGNLAAGLTVGSRVGNALVSIPRYLLRFIYPLDLSIYYPLPQWWPAWAVAASAGLILVISAATLWQARSRPYLLFGWLWFLILLAPTLGVVQVALHAMADRYMYLPMVGLLIMIVWGGGELAKAVGAGAAPAAVLASIGLIVLSLFTWYQQSFWRDTYALFTHALAVDPDNAFAHFVVGNALSDAGDDLRAADRYQRALAIDQRDPMFHYRYALSLGRLGRIDPAIAEFQEALRLRPQWATAHEMLARAYLLSGNPSAAQAHFDEARLIERNSSNRE
jgi:tetratricopeptide (TPR) repeat protein